MQREIISVPLNPEDLAYFLRVQQKLGIRRRSDVLRLAVKVLASIALVTDKYTVDGRTYALPREFGVTDETSTHLP